MRGLVERGGTSSLVSRSAFSPRLRAVKQRSFGSFGSIFACSPVCMVYLLLESKSEQVLGPALELRPREKIQKPKTAAMLTRISRDVGGNWRFERDPMYFFTVLSKVLWGSAGCGTVEGLGPPCHCGVGMCKAIKGGGAACASDLGSSCFRFIIVAGIFIVPTCKLGLASVMHKSLRRIWPIWWKKKRKERRWRRGRRAVKRKKKRWEQEWKVGVRQSGNRGADFAGEKGLAGFRTHSSSLGQQRSGKPLAGSSRTCQPGGWWIKIQIARVGVGKSAALRRCIVNRHPS